MIIKPNFHFKNNRNDYVNTKPKDAKIYDKLGKVFKEI